MPKVKGDVKESVKPEKMSVVDEVRKSMADQKEPTYAERLADSRKILGQAIPLGQAIFESPDGYIMLGPDDADDVFCRYSADGKGLRINRRRA